MLNSKVILLTGASRGIGRTLAKALAAEGATVILLSRTTKDLESLHDEIVQAGNPQPMIAPFNLCSATLEDYDDLRRNIDQQYGRLDGLIHNAGILGALSPIEHYDIHKWYQVLQVNLNSVFILTQATLSLLKKSPAASIIFTNTELSTKPKANWGAYAVASAGCHSMMQMLAAECENLTNIRVNAIQPSKVQTSLRAQAYPAEDKSALVKPDAILKQYLYLMSPESQEINGKVLDAIVA
jgi:NAD(P)-dependent dehydrogenase (short-subunit alcohol dehydrogenase family)